MLFNETLKKYFDREDRGSNPGVAGYLLCNRDQLRDSLCSTRVDRTLNGYLEKSGEDEQEVRSNAQDCPVLCTSWQKGHETETSTTSRDCKVQCHILYLFYLMFIT